MELLSVHFSSPSDFLAAYGDAGGKPSLFYKTRRDDLTPGQSVLVEIGYPGLPNNALVRAIVGEGAQAKGTTLWLAPQDRETVGFIAGMARGNIQVKRTYPRSAPRVPTTLPVDCRVEGDRPFWMKSQTEDLSSGGVFIRARTTPAIGTRVRLVIGPTHLGERFLVYGKVAWTRSGGFGVRFSSRGHSDARKLRAVLRKSNEAGKVAFA